MTKTEKYMFVNKYHVCIHLLPIAEVKHLCPSKSPNNNLFSENTIRACVKYLFEQAKENIVLIKLILEVDSSTDLT